MATTTTLEDMKRMARRYPEEVATGGNIDLIDEICTATVVDRSPLGEVEGRDALKKQMSGIRAAFSEFEATVDQLIAEDDTVAMRVTLSGVHDGSFMGIEPTGKAFETSNMVFTRFEDGQIAERWVLPDMLGMLSQVGALESPLE